MNKDTLKADEQNHMAGMPAVQHMLPAPWMTRLAALVSTTCLPALTLHYNMPG
jgi:hypothetical protein